jgi:hypothetical protein
VSGTIAPATNLIANLRAFDQQSCETIGIWAIEVGDRFPDARVRGIDLSPAQPAWVPPNVDFLVDDCEQGEWLDRNVDFVHFRFMTVVLKDVAGVLRRAYE